VAELPQRIAITGAAGLLGAADIARLAAAATVERIVAIDLRPTPIPPGAEGKVLSVTRDIREPVDDILSEHRIEAVVHLAYLLRPSRDPVAARRINVDATQSLLSGCDAAGVRQIVYPSSTTVYGAHPGFVRPFTEDDPPNPVRGFQYSEDKVAAERLLTAYAHEHPETAVSILRGCVIMAPGADNFIARALGKPVLPAPAGADPEMQFLHADDYSAAVEAALAARAKGVYNIAGAGTVRWRDMVAAAGGRLIPIPAPLLTAIVDLSWNLRLQNDSPACGLNFIRYPWLASTEKIERDLGWKPRHTSMEALFSWRARGSKAGPA